MDKTRHIVTGAFVVLIISSMTMVAAYPKVYSPYSFSVVMPAFVLDAMKVGKPFLNLLAPIPVVAIYCVWSIFSVKETYVIRQSTIILAVIIFAVSLFFTIGSYSYGLKYQGQMHTILIYIYTAIVAAILLHIYRSNRKSPSLANSVLFNTFLFSWLGWGAFPWLGELI